MTYNVSSGTLSLYTTTTTTTTTIMSIMNGSHEVEVEAVDEVLVFTVLQVASTV